MTINELFEVLTKKEMYLRLENDEEQFYLSIIDRNKYPRVWVDNFQHQQSVVVAETVEHLIDKTILADNDWMARFEGETLDEVVTECENWLICHNLI